LKKGKWLYIAILLASFTVFSVSCGTETGAIDEVAILETNYGRIVIEFYPKEAPKSVANFKSLSREGFYNGTKFHRLVRDQGTYIAIQGGDPNSISGDPSTWGMGQPGQKTVPAEFTANLKHVRGAVSMARKSGDVNSATSQFFICVSNKPEWDGQYTVFGKVIEGLNVVDTIVRAPMAPNSDKPVDPVTVSSISIDKLSNLKK
jgi:cyclophilin family peptidyl-prolyl cis-trans isomerase